MITAKEARHGHPARNILIEEFMKTIDQCIRFAVTKGDNFVEMCWKNG